MSTATFPGPVGPLEMLYRPGEGALAHGLPPAFVLCHPHPAHGGTLHNKVVYRIARALLGSGCAVLRFNFRGVGLSAGSYSGGPGERDDIRAALDHLASMHPDAPLGMAGFSFGAWNGLAVGCTDARVVRFVAAGLPVGTYPHEPFPATGRPLLAIHGAEDTFGSPEQLHAFVDAWDGPAEAVVVEGADHFFEPRLPLVTESLLAALRETPASRVRRI